LILKIVGLFVSE